MKNFNTDVVGIRDRFATLLRNGEFVTDAVSGSTTIEIVGASFYAYEDTIFGTLNEDWCAREVEWYLSQSLNINDIHGEVPSGWRAVAAEDGSINSNYGWCVYSPGNHEQGSRVVRELLDNPESRRAVCIYTRPEMWLDYDQKDRMNDFMCTNVVQYVIRNDLLNVVVQMRSNDAVWGYKGDRYWQRYVQSEILEALRNEEGFSDLEPGPIVWQVGSLHTYSRHFWLVDCWDRFRRFMPKNDYDLAVEDVGARPY